MQQVNLFTDAFRPKKVKLPLSQIIVLPLLIAAVFAGLSFWLERSLDLERDELAKLEASNNDLQGKIDVLQKRVSKLRKDDSLVAANKRLSQKLQARKDMVEVLDTVVVKDDEGFSGILLSLARQDIEPLWIDLILINDSGRHLRLEGVTTDSEAVPLYLQKLRQEQSFIGRTFMGFELSRNEDNKKFMNFSLYTSAEHNETASSMQDLTNGNDIVSFSGNKE